MFTTDKISKNTFPVNYQTTTHTRTPGSQSLSSTPTKHHEGFRYVLLRTLGNRALDPLARRLHPTPKSDRPSAKLGSVVCAVPVQTVGSVFAKSSEPRNLSEIWFGPM